jgi:hypothetical protein
MIPPSLRSRSPRPVLTAGFSLAAAALLAASLGACDDRALSLHAPGADITAGDGALSDENDTLFEHVIPAPVIITALDADGDTMLDVNETGCIDPTDPDSDDDGIPDGWEAEGIIAFDYPAAGADPCHRDLFVQVDYEERSNGMVTRSARLSPTVEQALVGYYGALPIANPDGTNGINLHLYQTNVLPAGFKCATEDSAYVYDPQAFHKVELCISNNGASKGVAVMPGRRLWITSPAANQDPADDLDEVAQYTWYTFFLHEMGHNLGLHHGGDVNANKKPHYPSVMNYLYDQTLAGSPKKLSNPGVRYTTSVQFPALLDECALDEQNSFPGATQADIAFIPIARPGFKTDPGGPNGPWIDWNRNNAFDAGLVAADVNDDGAQPTCGTAFADVSDVDILARSMGKGLPAYPHPNP